MATPYLGQIIMFAGDFAPQGWALCDGSLLPIAGYEALFNLIGTTYGGDGTSNFALPDLRGRVPIGDGQGRGLSGYALGQQAGAEAVTLAPGQLPLHTHPVAAVTASGNANVPAANAVLAALNGEVASGPYKVAAYAPPGHAIALNAASGSAAGGGEAHDNRLPYQSVTYCIALVGS